MKRLITLLLVLCIAISLSGCNVIEYKKAMDHYEAGEYAEAFVIYEALGDFADSAAMAEICWQKADYKQAEEWYAAGEYRKALKLYEGLSMYMDSPAKAIDCRYLIGLDCIASGAYREALSWLEPLGSYKDTQEQILQAKWQWLYSVAQAVPPTYRTDGTVSVHANEDGSLTLSYKNADALLGISYTKYFALTFQKDSTQGVYTAVYDSSSAGQVREEATGTVDISQFNAAAKLPVEVFTQTVIDPEGNETVSNQTTDALMMEGLLLDAKVVVCSTFSKLLNAAGLPIEPRELGFASME